MSRRPWIGMSRKPALSLFIPGRQVPRQDWLFAPQHDGRFEKRCEDFCQLLDELVTHGSVSKWAIEPMDDRKNYKVVLWHGPMRVDITPDYRKRARIVSTPLPDACFRNLEAGLRRG